MQGSLEPLTGLLCILMLAGTTLRLVTPLNIGLAGSIPESLQGARLYQMAPDSDLLAVT